MTLINGHWYNLDDKRDIVDVARTFVSDEYAEELRKYIESLERDRDRI